MTKTTLDELNTPKGVKYSTDILPNQQAILHFKGKTLLTSQSYLEVKAYEHALAFTVAKMLDKDLLKMTRDAILSAMENGTDFRTFKQTLMPYLSSQGWGNFTDDKKLLNRRLKTIFHTNMHSSYSAGQWQRIQQTKQFLPYLQYMPSVSAKKRDNHKLYYGLVRPVDDEIWQSIFPPNGYGCKCWVKQLTKRQAEKIGISDPVTLEMETVENPRTGEKMTTPKGVHFSFTHNHDRLTALLKLAEDKHGREFGDKLKQQAYQVLVEHKAEYLHKYMTNIEPRITQDIKSVAKNVNVTLAGLEFRLKTLSSLVRKIETDLNDGFALDVVLSKMRDVIRYTAILDYHDFFNQYQEIINQLKNYGYRLIVVKNTWHKGKPYKGINTIVEKDGIKFEIQYHTQESFDLKNGKLHELYEIARNDNTPFDTKREIQLKMIELSDKLKQPKNISSILNKSEQEQDELL